MSAGANLPAYSGAGHYAGPLPATLHHQIALAWPLVGSHQILLPATSSTWQDLRQDDKIARYERLLESASESYRVDLSNRKQQPRKRLSEGSLKQQSTRDKRHASLAEPSINKIGQQQAESVRQNVQDRLPGLPEVDQDLNHEDGLPWGEESSYRQRQPTRNKYSFQHQQQHKNKKPVYVSINQATVNGLLSLLLLFIISTCGCIGNIFIISALTVIESLQTRGNCFLVSLALAHLLVNLLVIPSSAIQIMAGDGMSLCRYQWLGLEFSLVVSQLSFFLMAADNYLSFKLSEKVTTSFELASQALQHASTSLDPNNQQLGNPRQPLNGGFYLALPVGQPKGLISSPQPPGTSSSGSSSSTGGFQQISEQILKGLTKEQTNPAPLTSEPASAPVEQADRQTSGRAALMSKQSLANEQPLKAPLRRAIPLDCLQFLLSAICLKQKWRCSLCCFDKNRCVGSRVRLTRQFVNYKEEEAKLYRGPLLGYRNLCGKFKVLVWIISVWVMALLYTIHQHNFSYASKFCSPLGPSTNHSKNASQPAGGAGRLVKNLSSSLGLEPGLLARPDRNHSGELEDEEKLIKGDIERAEVKVIKSAKEDNNTPANGFLYKHLGTASLEVKSSKISSAPERTSLAPGQIQTGRKRPGRTADLTPTKLPREFEPVGLLLVPANGGLSSIDFKSNLTGRRRGELPVWSRSGDDVFLENNLNYLARAAADQPETLAQTLVEPPSKRKSEFIWAIGAGGQPTTRGRTSNNLGLDERNGYHDGDDDDEEPPVDNEKLVMRASRFGLLPLAVSCHRNKSRLAPTRRPVREKPPTELSANSAAFWPKANSFEYKDNGWPRRDSGGINRPASSNGSSSKAKEASVSSVAVEEGEGEGELASSSKSPPGPPVLHRPNRKFGQHRDRWLILTSEGSSSELSLSKERRQLGWSFILSNGSLDRRQLLPVPRGPHAGYESESLRARKFNLLKVKRTTTETLERKFETFLPDLSDASKLMNNNNGDNKGTMQIINKQPSVSPLERAHTGGTGRGLPLRTGASMETPGEIPKAEFVPRRRSSSDITKRDYFGAANNRKPETVGMSDLNPVKFVSNEHQMVLNSNTPINSTFGQAINWQAPLVGLEQVASKINQLEGTLPSHYWLVVVCCLVIPSFASIILFLRAYFNMKQFKLRQYSPVSPSLFRDYPSPFGSGSHNEQHQEQQQADQLVLNCKKPSPVLEERDGSEEKSNSSLKSRNCLRMEPIELAASASPKLVEAPNSISCPPKPSLSACMPIDPPNQIDNNLLAAPLDYNCNRRSVSQPNGSGCFFPAEQASLSFGDSANLSEPSLDYQTNLHAPARLSVASIRPSPPAPPPPPATPTPGTSATRCSHQRLNQALSAPIGYDRSQYVARGQLAGLGPMEEILHGADYPTRLSVDPDDLQLARIKASSFNAHTEALVGSSCPGSQNHQPYFRRDTSFSAPPSATFFRPRGTGELLFSTPFPDNPQQHQPHQQQQQQQERELQVSAGTSEMFGAQAGSRAPLGGALQRHEFRRRNFHAQSFHYGCSLANIRSQKQGSLITSGVGSNPSVEFLQHGLSSPRAPLGYEQRSPAVPAFRFHESVQTNQQHLSPGALITKRKDRHQQQQQQQHFLLARHRSLPHSSELDSFISSAQNQPILRGPEFGWQQQPPPPQLAAARRARRRRRSVKKSLVEHTIDKRGPVISSALEKVIKSSSSVEADKINTTIDVDEQTTEPWTLPTSKLPVAPVASTSGPATIGDQRKVVLCTYSYMTDEQLLKSNITVFLVNLVLWLPFLFLSIASQFRDQLTQELRDTVWWLATLNCCSCSYIYAITNRDFREAFNKLFYYCCCKSHVTFQKRMPIYRRQIDVDSKGNLRVHLIPGLNNYSSRLTNQGPGGGACGEALVLGPPPHTHQLGVHKPTPSHPVHWSEPSGRPHQVGFGGPLFAASKSAEQQQRHHHHHNHHHRSNQRDQQQQLQQHSTRWIHKGVGQV